ncbi:MAG: O-antigen ligase family protein [Pseudomonadota bacterium]
MNLSSAAALMLGIIGFQGHLASFFSPWLTQQYAWRFFYYGYWIAVLGLTLATLALDWNLFRRSSRLLLICGLSSALVALHPSDWVAKNYLVALGLCASTAVLATAAGHQRILAWSAVVTALNAGICIVAALLPNPVTNPSGRVSGLAENPNIAAAELLLGIVIAWRAIPSRAQIPFLLLVTAGIVATLSRSTLLVAAVILIGVAAPHLRQIRLKTRDIALAAILIVSWLTTAIFINPDFWYGKNSVFYRIGQIPASTKTFVDAIFAPAASPGRQDRAGGSPGGAPPFDDAKDGSAEARAAFLRESWLAYQSAPATGWGLGRAYALAPHNSYLLFAVAFGAIGWLVPIAFIALMFTYSRRDWPLPMTVAGLMLFSHDTLLLPASTMLLGLGFSQLIAISSPLISDQVAV